MSRPESGRTPSTNYRPSARPLDGRLAIVTGASRGIGAAIADALAARGAYVVLGYTSDKSTEKVENIAKDIEAKHGVSTLIVQADMGHANGPAHIVNTAKNHFSHPRSGKFQIDIIINNAGVANNLVLEKVTVEDFQRQYAVNVLGPILLMQAALPYLPHDRSGRVVNLSSISSSLGLPEQTVYGGTKAALESMTRTWSRELAERATVNAVNPGPVDTDMYGSVDPNFAQMLKSHILHTPLMKERPGIDPEHHVKAAPTTGGRPGYEHEIAGVVVMLCSDESAWCTGSVICANGGMKFSY